MQALKGILGVGGTIVIAGWVAYAISAPRNVDNALDQPMDSLGGSSINQQIAEAKAEADLAQCEQYRDMASKAWDRAVENDTVERDADKLAELDRGVDRFCY